MVEQLKLDDIIALVDAQARIIDAAPELLEALEAYANGYLLDEFHNPALCYDDAHRAAVSKVFAAIAKARGLGGEV